MIVYMISNKTLTAILSELFNGGWKLNISPLFITQSYFVVSGNIKLNFAHYLILKISRKWELKEIAFKHSSDFKDFMNLYK